MNTPIQKIYDIYSVRYVNGPRNTRIKLRKHLGSLQARSHSHARQLFVASTNYKGDFIVTVSHHLHRGHGVNANALSTQYPQPSPM